MSIRKKAKKQWPEEEIKKYLDECSAGVKTTWFVLPDFNLYGNKGADGVEYTWADDDALRNNAIVEYLKNQGGTYEYEPKGK